MDAPTEVRFARRFLFVRVLDDVFAVCEFRQVKRHFVPARLVELGKLFQRQVTLIHVTTGLAVCFEHFHHGGMLNQAELSRQIQRGEVVHHGTHHDVPHGLQLLQLFKHFRVLVQQNKRALVLFRVLIIGNQKVLTPFAEFFKKNDESKNIGT